MTTQTRHVDQQYWRHARMPHVEIRSTQNSTIGYKAHSHAELSIGIIESGHTCMTCTGLSCGDGDWILGPGDMILVPPQLVHSCNPVKDEPRSYHMIYLEADWCLQTLSRIYDRPIRQLSIDPVVVRKQALARTYMDDIAHRLETEQGLLEQFLLQTLSTHCDIDTNGTTQAEVSDLAQRVKQALLHDLAAPPTIEHLAAKLHTTSETIIRSFKKAYGITPKAFLGNARIEKAKILLRNHVPIVEAALDVGYADQSQFHKAFVAFCAATPKQYQDTKTA